MSDNFLGSGSVLPHGLLSHNPEDFMRGFNRTYQNTALRVGMISNIYPISNSKNLSKLTTEYDVTVIQQDSNKGIASITYKNCMSAEGFGAVADFFERTLRNRAMSNTKNPPVDFKGQNGAIVLILCLDAITEKGIIIGALTHPDRETTLVDDKPHLEGEYNGCHIVINSDGSAAFTFKGPTDNDGKLLNPDQVPTVVRVEKDGSYQVSSKGITQRFDESGVASLAADDNITNTTKKDFAVTAQGNINMTATKDMNAQMSQLVIQAQGSASLACDSLSINAQSSINVVASQFQLQAQGLANVKAPIIVLDGLVNLGGNGGQPVLLLSTIMIGTGNLGAPVVSNPISGYAIKTLAN